MRTVTAQPFLIDRVISPSLKTSLLQVLVGSWFLALLAQVLIPLPFTPVPITGQTLGVLLIGATFGPRKAMATVLFYLLQGGLGLPFFAGGAYGWLKLAGPSAGYLYGMVIAAGVMGWLSSETKKLSRALGLFALGHFIIFICGIAWLSAFVSLDKVLYLGLIPFIPGMIIKTVLAAGLLPSFWKWAK